MIDGHKVICVTPSGRQRYMELLVPMILSSDIVDEYQIWVNTTNQSDLYFLSSLPSNDKRIRLIYSDIPHNGNLSIYRFFRQAIEPRTVYIRFDDDIVWIEKDSIEKIARFRINNPQYFLTSPIIINNAVITSLLIMLGKITDIAHIRPNVLDDLAWKDPIFAYHLHKRFIGLINNNNLDSLRFDKREISLNRWSINCISWLGDFFRTFNGEIGEDEEEYITTVKPTQLGMPNCIHGDTMVSHFSFFTQRDHLDNTEILSEYKKIFQDSDWVRSKLNTNNILEWWN